MNASAAILLKIISTSPRHHGLQFWCVQYDDLGADRNASVEVDDVRIDQAEASGGHGMADRLRLICAVHAVDRAPIYSARAPIGLPGPPAIKRGK